MMSSEPRLSCSNMASHSQCPLEHVSASHSQLAKEPRDGTMYLRKCSRMEQAVAINKVFNKVRKFPDQSRAGPHVLPDRNKLKKAMK